MKKLLLILSIVLTASLGYAQFYVGGGIGNSFYNLKLEDLNGDNFKLNENSLGWKLYAGIGKDFLRLEGGYRSLGSVTSVENGIEWESTTSAWDIAAKGQIKFGPIYGNAKAGAAFYKNKFSALGISETENTTSFLWGIGAGLMLGKLGVGLTYESVDMSNDNNLAQLMLDFSIVLGGEE